MIVFVRELHVGANEFYLRFTFFSDMHNSLGFYNGSSKLGNNFAEYDIYFRGDIKL